MDERARGEDDLGMTVTCDCPEEGHFGDCLVSFILDRPEGAVVFNAAEERAIRALGRAGLLPEARWRRLTG